jgi:phosphohistidine phosphatase
MTTLYLIRHGIAAERGTYANDGDRPLTDKGVDKTQRMARRCHEVGVRADLILSSPLVRAQQTADILKASSLAADLITSDDLAPEGSIGPWVEWLKNWHPGAHNALILVGHQPDLGHWAEQLVWGAPTGRLVLKKAGIIGVQILQMKAPLGTSELFWLTPPRYFVDG